MAFQAPPPLVPYHERETLSAHARSFIQHCQTNLPFYFWFENRKVLVQLIPPYKCQKILTYYLMCDKVRNRFALCMLVVLAF